MYRRWIYMTIAIIASALLISQTVFSFKEDKGIIYIRSFSMDQTTFYVTQTELATGAEEITATMSVAGLYYCARTLMAVCLLCFLCFFSNRWRMILAVLGAILAGVYYVLMIYYAVKITDFHYTTLYPNFWAVLPAIVLQMMVLTWQNVARYVMTLNENEEKEEMAE